MKEEGEVFLSRRWVQRVGRPSTPRILMAALAATWVLPVLGTTRGFLGSWPPRWPLGVTQILALAVAVVALSLMCFPRSTLLSTRSVRLEYLASTVFCLAGAGSTARGEFNTLVESVWGASIVLALVVPFCAVASEHELERPRTAKAGLLWLSGAALITYYSGAFTGKVYEDPSLALVSGLGLVWVGISPSPRAAFGAVAAVVVTAWFGGLTEFFNQGHPGLIELRGLRHRLPPVVMIQFAAVGSQILEKPGLKSLVARLVPHLLLALGFALIAYEVRY